MTSMDEMFAQMNDPSTVVGRNHLRYMKAWRIQRRVMAATLRRIPLIGSVIESFWSGVFDISMMKVSLSGGLWSVQYSHLGDYFFWHQPMTEDYYQGRLSKIPWPRRLHIHIAPCYPFWKDKETGKRHRSNERCTR